MLENIKDNSIIICNNNIKKDILLSMSKNKILKNIKFITINDFIKNYYGDYDINAIYYVMKKYGYSYDVTKEYLNNIFYKYDVLDSLYQDLLENNYLIFNDLFKSELNNKNIYLIGYPNIDKYVLLDLEKLNTTFLELDSNSYEHIIYKCETQTDEIEFVLQDIITNHSTELNKVFLVNVQSDYTSELKRLCNLYHLNINLNENNSIYSTNYVQLFINNLKQTYNLDDSLNLIEDTDIKNKVIDLINRFTFNIDDISIEIITNELKRINKDVDLLDDAITVIDFNDINDASNYYYILNFNQGSVPASYHDDDLISDEIKQELKLNTSLDKVINFKNNIINILKNYPNIIITYKLRDSYKTYIKSPLIDELNLKESEVNLNNYNYSNAMNRIKLAYKLDDYFKFNIEDESLKDLYTTYNDIDYQTYDNKFKQVDYSILKQYLNNKLTLSYSSINNFFHCPFRYYINNILKLNIYEETFDTLVGNLYHYCLSKMYDKDFDLRKSYTEFLSDKKLSNKEQFFIDNLYSNLETIIKTIKYQESKSKYDKTECEKSIKLSIDNDMDTSFIGFVDKIKIYEENDIKYISIIDYKTGSIKASLDNINYGLNLQLPVYIYLIKKTDNKSVITGFYLQKLLQNISIDSDDSKEETKGNLKLIGYTINDETLINNFDSTYLDSEVIRGMKVSSKGFYAYTKLFNEIDIDKIVDLVDKHINEVLSNIKLGKFDISPKRIDNDELVGCEFCQFKDLCFRKEEDIVDLKTTKYEDIVGGE